MLLNQVVRKLRGANLFLAGGKMCPRLQAAGDLRADLSQMAQAVRRPQGLRQGARDRRAEGVAWENLKPVASAERGGDASGPLPDVGTAGVLDRRPAPFDPASTGHTRPGRRCLRSVARFSRKHKRRVIARFGRRLERRNMGRQPQRRSNALWLAWSGQSPPTQPSTSVAPPSPPWLS